MTDKLKIGLGFQLTTYTGWGVVGMNIALQLAAMPDVELSFWSADFAGLNPLDVMRLKPIAQRCQLQLADAYATQTPVSYDGVLLWADGNSCTGPNGHTSAIRSERNMGLMVFEDTAITPEKAERLKRYDWLVTASRWNQQILESHGVPNTLVPQGIDPTVWHPAPKSGRWRDRFVVFSGGKLEYRKGQDIVVAAFREFHKSHPEALLVTAWQNMTLNGHVEHEPICTADGVDVEGWCLDNGIPDGAHLDVGILPNVFLAPIVREADVAVFASRAEGGTNLMAMECMAAGVPTIVSGNTGHDDLFYLGHREVFSGLSPKKPSRFFGAIDGWGETNPAHLAGHLGARQRSLNTRPPTWQHHTEQLVNLITAADARTAA
jgi:glycosyltransferase involved in cell wall biosynthesis